MRPGRILYQDTITSARVAALSDFSKLLYTWLIPFLDDEGRTVGDADRIKDMIFYRENYIHRGEQIKLSLGVLDSQGLIRWYDGGDGHKYIQFPDFESVKGGRGSLYPPPPMG